MTDQSKTKLQLCINEEIDRFFDESSKPSDGIPKFRLYTGIPGAGKTTARHQQCPKGFVVIDANEIYRNLCEKSFQHYNIYADAIELLGSLIAERALRERRNVVVEMIGKHVEPIEKLADGFKAIGYETQLRFIHCGCWEEALRRHNKKVEEDQMYISCYFTEKDHERWLLEGLKNYHNELKRDSNG